MGLLGDFAAYIDNLKRRGMNTAKDLASDPMGLLGRNVSASPDPSLYDSLKRAAGLTARYAIEGPAQIAGMAINPLTVAAGRGNWTDALSRTLTSAGLPSPSSEGERISAEVSKAIAGGAPLVRGAQALASGAGAVPGVIKSMVAAPVAEIAAQGVGAGAAQATREEGYPEWAALLAGVAAPMAAQGVALNAPTMGLLGHNVYRGGPNEFDKLMPRMLDLDKPLSQQSKTVRTLAVPPAHRDAYKLGLNHAKQNAVYDDMPMSELERFNRMSDAESAFYEAGARRLPPPLISDGYRFGKAPDGRSTNFADNVPEKGVSMASVTDPRFDDSWEKTISSMFIKPGRKKYTYQGSVLPPAMSGADGEPLMVGLRAPETGLEFYQRLQKLYGGEDGAAKTLRERGLLGVRRAAGDGVYNYVVFE